MNASDITLPRLRGTLWLPDEPGRLLEEEATTDFFAPNVIMLQQPDSFQIVMSVLLGMLALLQLGLLAAFIANRQKRVLEFAQPVVLFLFLGAAMVVTGACYLFLHISDGTCLIRDPIVFVALSFMGSTIAGRAWRISTLMSNPLMSMGKGPSNDTSRVEMARQWLLQVLTTLSGCNVRGLVQRKSEGGRPIRVQISVSQMMLAISILLLPQLLFQIAVVLAPALRAVPQISYSGPFQGIQIGHYECQSHHSAATLSASLVLAMLPYCCAYLLNIRPKEELDQLPDIIDEREPLKASFATFLRVLVITVPIIGLSVSPSARAYASICAVLGLPLSLCYHIAYTKLASLSRTDNISRQQSRRRSSAFQGSSNSNGDGNNSNNNAVFAVKMAEMYEKMGRVSQTIQLVDETLGTWKKGNSATTIATNALSIGQRDREEIGAGFTMSDLKALDPDELHLIIQLLRIKGQALIKLHGVASGIPMSAKINIDVLKIFENCPASTKMKDVSIIFPVYNMVGIHLRGEIIDQDDECTLELELAQQFCHEAQLQACHFARALINLAEIYGRRGLPDQALKYFNIMKAVYMPSDHPKLLLEAYAQDQCAQGFATSALWYLQQGYIDKAFEQCDYATEHILPNYPKDKDKVGLYRVLIQIIRVLKWNGKVDRARQVYNDNTPEGVENHFIVGFLHKPMSLLLRICDGSSEVYNPKDMSADIEMALAFDISDMSTTFTDFHYTGDGWSMKSMSAELCYHLARRMEPGSPVRGRLVKKGMQMSILANDCVLASNGMIRHILAYEAHKEIHAKLLKLANEDNASCRSVIYEGKQLDCSPKSLRDSTEEMEMDSSRRNTADDSSRRNMTDARAFAERFVVREETNGSANESGSGSNSHSESKGRPSQVDIKQKLVSFTQKVSSIGNGSSVSHECTAA